MKKDMFFKKATFLTAILAAVLFLQPQGALADGHGGHGRKHFTHRHHRGITMPNGYISIALGGLKFCYRDSACTAYRPYRQIFIPAPIVSIPERVIIAETPGLYGERVVVNIPNSNGSYTSVTLRKYGNGYLGPQGEYYPAHPTVEDLSVLYGK
ncbi:MAG: hypothetical protein JW994_05375 [Candidatus Omnitrophica bacterium]|nr:hypothetical protein [Candidatus Omnitrophota bacterium]